MVDECRQCCHPIGTVKSSPAVIAPQTPLLALPCSPAAVSPTVPIVGNVRAREAQVGGVSLHRGSNFVGLRRRRRLLSHLNICFHHQSKNSSFKDKSGHSTGYSNLCSNTKKIAVSMCPEDSILRGIDKGNILVSLGRYDDICH
jgi:hypothetical protein